MIAYLDIKYWILRVVVKALYKLNLYAIFCELVNEILLCLKVSNETCDLLN